jgi:hypothetical protein
MAQDEAPAPAQADARACAAHMRARNPAAEPKVFADIPERDHRVGRLVHELCAY